MDAPEAVLTSGAWTPVRVWLRANGGASVLYTCVASCTPAAAPAAATPTYKLVQVADGGDAADAMVYDMTADGVVLHEARVTGVCCLPRRSVSLAGVSGSSLPSARLPRLGSFTGAAGGGTSGGASGGGGSPLLGSPSAMRRASGVGERRPSFVRSPSFSAASGSAAASPRKSVAAGASPLLSPASRRLSSLSPSAASRSSLSLAAAVAEVRASEATASVDTEGAANVRRHPSRPSIVAIPDASAPASASSSRRTSMRSDVSATEVALSGSAGGSGKDGALSVDAGALQTLLQRVGSFDANLQASLAAYLQTQGMPQQRTVPAGAGPMNGAAALPRSPSSASFVLGRADHRAPPSPAAAAAAASAAAPGSLHLPAAQGQSSSALGAARTASPLSVRITSSHSVGSLGVPTSPPAGAPAMLAPNSPPSRLRTVSRSPSTRMLAQAVPAAVSSAYSPVRAMPSRERASPHWTPNNLNTEFSATSAARIATLLTEMKAAAPPSPAARMGLPHRSPSATDDWAQALPSTSFSYRAPLTQLAATAATTGGSSANSPRRV